MSRFLQIHYLTIYPVSNPNRDDLGRPKTANYGGVPRLRISSQALKRAARLSDVMQVEMKGYLGERTQRIGEAVRDALVEACETEERAVEIAKEVAGIFGKLDTRAAEKGAIRTRQLAFISPEERRAAIGLSRKILAGENLPDGKNLKKLVLRTADGAVDVAMFGRMLADDPDFNREAAVQVSHALTTHRALVEDDYYTAVDDLKLSSEDAGAGFVGEAGFGSGVFYTYACVNSDLLAENLSGDRELAARATASLAEALATATPSGKRNSYAHQTRAGYIRVEAGDAQPRSLAGAFFRPVEGDDLMAASVIALEQMVAQMDAAYGDCYEASEVMNVAAGRGTLAAVRTFATNAVNDD